MAESRSLAAGSIPSQGLHAVRDLIAQISEQADTIEQSRALPAEIVSGLKSAGAFRALIPAQFNGLEAPFEEYIKTIQALAAADASTAWCVNQAAVIGLSSLWMPMAKIEEIWSDPLTSVANGPPFECLLSRDGAGYRLNGHWGFSSGCQHAVWMMGATPFDEGGWRIAFFRPSEVTFEDNWQTAGLRGTGSFEFRAKDLSVAADQIGDMGAPATVAYYLAQLPNTLLFAVSFASVALGIAQASLNDVLEIAQGKLPRYAKLHLRDDPDVQRFVGKAQARWRAAHAYLHTTVAEVLAAVRANAGITHDERSQLRMVGTHTIRECAEVVDLAYKIAGSTGIYQDQTLQRRFQDMHVITQHVQAREAYFAMLGRYAISGEYELGPMS